MPDIETTSYHFAEACNQHELTKKSEDLFQHGWRKAGDMRQIEIRLPGDRATLRYSQIFSRSSGGNRAMRCLGLAPGYQPKVFWDKIAPCEHWLQVYPDDSVLLDSLENFAGTGLEGGDAVVVIGTPGHLASLDERLTARGIDLSAARHDDRYIALDAEETLSRFMVNGWPDEQLFRDTIRGVLKRARQGGRRVRAFGEMVGLLWARGDCSATVRLEQYWHVLCQLEDLPLFCAYPRSGFTLAQMGSLQDICSAHSRVID